MFQMCRWFGPVALLANDCCAEDEKWPVLSGFRMYGFFWESEDQGRVDALPLVAGLH